MRVLFVWTGVTSYMAGCWRALQALPGVGLHIVIEPVASGREFDAKTVLEGLDYEFADAASVDPDALSFVPDVIFAVGWRSRVVRAYVGRCPSVPKVCVFDMPWRNSLRCVAARFVLWGYLRNFAAAYVPGARAARYAKWLGFRRIEKGLFAIDVARFAAAAEVPRRGFCYVGRLSGEKRVDLVLDAYRRYRAMGGTAPLDIYGGEGESSSEGVSYRGFLQPEAIPGVFRSHVALLLASAFDPWPLVVLEAKAAGCAAIVSDRCGNAAELGASAVPYGDASAMAAAMLALERGELPSAPADLSPYSAGAWAARTLALAEEVVR